jgi:transposase
MKTYVGLDIGKFEIYYQYATNGKVVSGSFANTKEAITTFISQLPPAAHAVMEATGVYHFPLAFALQDKQILCTILNPIVSAGFARSMNSISKTDKSDSALLARFGEERSPEATLLQGHEWYAFRQLIQRWEDLKIKKQVIENQLKEQDFYPKNHAIVSQQLKDELCLIEAQSEAVCKHIEQELPKNYEELINLASSIKGIGKKTAIHLLFFTQGLEGFDSHKQLAKYLGIAPNIYQSGRTKKKGHICRRGNSLLRSLLYNCAKSAKRYNSACKEIYQRLQAKGKPHKVAMVAVMHKLVKQFFAVIKSGMSYNDTYHIAV